MSVLKSRLALIVVAALAALLTACNMTVGDSPTATPALNNDAAPTLGAESTASGEAFITITSPSASADGSPAVVDPAGFTVIGAQQGSFENNVVVQALDAQGNVLGQAVATAAGEPGQVGTWETTLSAQTTAGTPGQIHAFFTSAQDGSVVAETSLDVIYDTAAIPADG
ncbi:MAG TPA: Gmad2 immunoglobulin-like domain-containing protein [Aggregatilinea sp.]|uniref:Gmad2 immunoglobulin-like domain-containing protein n=1 Tax=Aggregatilinea sp. TaxID=2806333 RepID=UPI002CFBD462|nr:Gmad2 immunoglobulin-like domain-containing protein [Aggregatilinea sp.]HML23929.1 Gmad2 immunoglobulin-like domain-containing protein [Aggregatilinea sp.]